MACPSFSRRAHPTRSKIRASSCISPSKHTAKSVFVHRTTSASRFKESGQSSRRTARRASNRILRCAPRVGKFVAFPISAPLVDTLCTTPVPVNSLLLYKAGIERRYRGAIRRSSLGCLGSISHVPLSTRQSPVVPITLKAHTLTGRARVSIQPARRRKAFRSYGTSVGPEAQISLRKIVLLQ